ncbi:MAG: hypothetical protein ACI8ZN_002130 [Bacteroidia bacterium]
MKEGILGVLKIDFYLDIVDGALFFDNSYGKHELFAQKFDGEELHILDEPKFLHLKEFYD